MFDQKDGSLAELVRKRYQSFDTEIGAQIEVTCTNFLFSSSIFNAFLCLIWTECMLPQAGKADFDFLEKKVKEWGEPKVASAKQVTKPLYPL